MFDYLLSGPDPGWGYNGYVPLPKNLAKEKFLKGTPFTTSCQNVLEANFHWLHG